MTEEMLLRAKSISDQLRKYNRILNDLEAAKSYDDPYHPAIYKIRQTSLEIEIPDELRETISSVLFMYYNNLAIKAQKEFENL